MKYNHTKSIAFGGILAALAIVIMCLGGLIPVATYACPVLCVVLLDVVFVFCGQKIAWAWYGAVTFLSLIMGPDKEAATLFVFIGYYPIVKLFFEKWYLPWLWKLIFFNTMIVCAYSVMIYVFGLYAITEEFAILGKVLSFVMLVMGNVALALVDVILTRIQIKAGR